ncbi:formylglycine-generating enzyme family protein [Nannocystaceae bacterium ST9]
MTPDDERWRLGLGIPPEWACAWGLDEFGVFACVRVGEVEQRMRWIGPGRFMMGSPETEEGRWKDEGPRHRVELTRGYWLADTPCTQAMWQAVVGSNPSRFTGSGKRPVEHVSWDDVHEFLSALDARVKGFAARLPSEAEWEYACRAESEAARYGKLEEIAWYSENSGRKTHEVGLLKPNRWGLYDMLGNVDEWCADGWRRDYEARALVVDPFKEHGPKRVFRGGGWRVVARFVRAAYRNARDPDVRYDDLGFRLARGQELRQGNQQQAREPVPENR